MKQTQNQFFGLKKDIPKRLESGSSFVAVDTNELYIAADSGLLFKASTSNRDDFLNIGKNLFGWQDFADSKTSEQNQIVKPDINGGRVQLTNNNNDTLTDGNTNVNAETTVEGLNDTWDTTTNTFIFKDTGIEKNDRFAIRFHVNISADIISQDFKIILDFYDEPGGQGNYIFSLSKKAGSITKSAGVFEEAFPEIRGFIGESILNGSAIAYVYGTKSFKVENIGYNIEYFKIAR